MVTKHSCHRVSEGNWELGGSRRTVVGTVQTQACRPIVVKVKSMENSSWWKLTQEQGCPQYWKASSRKSYIKLWPPWGGVVSVWGLIKARYWRCWGKWWSLLSMVNNYSLCCSWRWTHSAEMSMVGTWLEGHCDVSSFCSVYAGHLVGSALYNCRSDGQGEHHPKFDRPWPLPFVLKEHTEQELKHLKDARILKQVIHS